MKPSAVVPFALALLLLALGTAAGVLLYSMESRLATSEERLAELEEEISGWEQHLGAVGQTAQALAALEEKHGELSSRVADLECFAETTDGRLELLMRDANTMTETLAGLRHDFLVAVGEDPEALPERLAKLEMLESDLAALGGQVTQLSKRITDLEESQEEVLPPDNDWLQ